MSGENGKLTGDVLATSTYKVDGTVYDNNTVNLNFTGAGTKHEGILQAEGHNTINSNYTGEGVSFMGNAENTGTKDLVFDNHATMTGDINNNKDRDDEHGVDVFGSLHATFNNGSVWTGNLTATAGSDTTFVTLDGGNTWTGTASDNGDIAVQGNSTWNLTNSSYVSNVTLDKGSYISMAGTAHELEMG